MAKRHVRSMSRQRQHSCRGSSFYVVYGSVLRRNAKCCWVDFSTKQLGMRLRSKIAVPALGLFHCYSCLIVPNLDAMVGTAPSNCAGQ